MAMEKIKCFFLGHLWIEWEHSNRRTQDFYPTTAILVNPECARCGVKKYSSVAEALKNKPSIITKTT